MIHSILGSVLAGAAAGGMNGLFGAGGGMLLIPLLRKLTDIQEQELFPTSVSVMLSLTLVSVGITAMRTSLPFSDALPYLIGSAAGGIAAGMAAEKISALWLHRILGLMILWGGIRFLWM